MSYLESRITVEQYLNNIQDRAKKNHMSSILNQFNQFCKQNYNKTHQEIMDDLKEEIDRTKSNDKLYVLFNNYKNWLSEEHPEISYYVGTHYNQKKTIKKRHPNSIKQYLAKMRNIFEEICNIEINSRIFNKRIRNFVFDNGYNSNRIPQGSNGLSGWITRSKTLLDENNIKVIKYTNKQSKQVSGFTPNATIYSIKRSVMTQTVLKDELDV